VLFRIIKNMLTATLDVLMENAFNQVSDMFDVDFSQLGMGENVIEESLETIDSRLDVESVLIEDIKLGFDAPDYNPTASENEDTVHQNEEISSDEKDTFFPQQRNRCNTWPRKEQERTVPDSYSPPPSTCYPGQALSCVSEEDAREEEDDDNSSENSFKCVPSGRRNPWGNSSYADLITQAIQSVPDRRLTLSQIYEWMVAIVPYFSDRTNSSSSAGWKNSIRHNLSLHQKFLKIPNEGAGKSSWWTLNPENSSIKKPRRRATSGDIRTLQSKREKVKKRVEPLKINEKLVRSTSINSSPSLSPSYNSISSHDRFRPRANSYTGNYDGFFSSFRSRNLSNSSSTAPESPLHMDDLSSLNFSYPTHLSRKESNLDSIPLDDLTIESEPLALESFTNLVETINVNSVQKVKILEPRENSYSRQAWASTSSTSDLPEREAHLPALSYVTPLHVIDKHEHDEVRKMMIIKQLNQLTQMRREVLQEHTNNTDNRVQNDYEMKIMLLQDQLNKLTREQEMLKINQNTAASNNPYFSVYNSYTPMYNGQSAPSDVRREIIPSTVGDSADTQDFQRMSCNNEPQYSFSDFLRQEGF